jgi:ATP phosphoribosyltransferase
VYLVFARAEDIPWIVASGAADLGVTGYDYVLESEADVEIAEDLGFGRARLVVAVPSESKVEDPRQLEGARIATKYVNVARRFFDSLGVRVKLFRISGAAEVMPRLGVADAIVDVVSTGTTLVLHGLKPIAVITETSARLILSPRSSGKRRRVAEEIVDTIRAVVRGRSHRLLLLNVPDRYLQRVLSVLPSMAGPMVARIESKEPMWEVITAVPENRVNEVIARARSQGARDILVLRMERVVP